jgi:hypothetical protein
VTRHLLNRPARGTHFVLHLLRIDPQLRSTIGAGWHKHIGGRTAKDAVSSSRE